MRGSLFPIYKERLNKIYYELYEFLVVHTVSLCVNNTAFVKFY